MVATLALDSLDWRMCLFLKTPHATRRRHVARHTFALFYETRFDRRQARAENRFGRLAVVGKVPVRARSETPNGEQGPGLKRPTGNRDRGLKPLDLDRTGTAIHYNIYDSTGSTKGLGDLQYTATAETDRDSEKMTSNDNINSMGENQKQNQKRDS
jgi:hypothetical protein